MRTRVVLFVAAVAIIAGVGIALSRSGVGPAAYPEGCSALVQGHSVGIDIEQAENATLIAAIGVRRGLPARAVSIALATAYQESKIRNLTHGDRDSVGLFQQRPSQGWGRRAQILDESYAINRFYDALAQVAGYETMQITVAAQRVQRSGFPGAYAAHAADARALASALTGYSPGGQFSCVVHGSSQRGTADAVVGSLSRGFGYLNMSRTGSRQDLAVRVPPGTAGNRTGWAVAAYLLAHAKRLHITAVSFDHQRWQAGKAAAKGWTSHAAARPTVVSVSLG
ncbi:MAG: hypothetical protein M3130_00260 [Actinomycetota bacterium]|nr:hypothetical protein [Actinomycetota bacterium]